MPMESFFLCDLGSLGAATGTGAAMLSIHTSLNGFSSASTRHSFAYTTVLQPGQRLSQLIRCFSLLAQHRVCCWTAIVGKLNMCEQRWEDNSCMVCTQQQRQSICWCTQSGVVACQGQGPVQHKQSNSEVATAYTGKQAHESCRAADVTACCLEQVCRLGLD